MDLREQLQRTLGNAYTIERELGGGGMSQLFVAEETALGRKVVVKVDGGPVGEHSARSCEPVAHSSKLNARRLE